MDTTTIDHEFEQLQAEFRDVAKTVGSLAAKMQAAEKAGDANAAEWLRDLKQVAHDIDDEQTQVKALLVAIHGFIGGFAQTPQASPAAAEAKPPLFAPGHEPDESEAAQPQRHGMLGGMLGGMIGGGMGGGMFGGYYGGGFGRAMEMGMAMNLGANLVNSIFR